MRGRTTTSLLLVGLLLLSSASAFGTPEDDVTAVTESTSKWQVYPTLETSENVTHAAWISRGSGWNGPTDILHARSLDDGGNWSTPVRLNAVTGKAYAPYREFQPSIALDGEEVVIAWVSKQTNPMRLVFQRSTDAGATWSGETLAHALTGNQNAQFAKVAFDGQGDLHIAWQQSEGSHPDNLEGPRNLVAIRSDDGGASWSAPVIIDGHNTGNRNDDPENGYPCDCCAHSLLGKDTGGLDVVYRHVEYDSTTDEWLNVVAHMDFDGINSASDYTALAPAWRTEGVICPSTDAALARHVDGLLVAWSDGRSGDNEVWAATLNGTEVGAASRLGSGDMPDVVAEGDWLRATWHDTDRDLCFAEGNLSTGQFNTWTRETTTEEELPALTNRSLIWSRYVDGSWELAAMAAPMPDWLWPVPEIDPPEENGTGNETVDPPEENNTGNETVDPPDGNETVDPPDGNETVDPPEENNTGNETVDPPEENETVDPEPEPEPEPEPFEWPEATVGEMAPDFRLTDVEGNVFNLSGLRGQKVVIDLAATWCSNCAVFGQEVLSPLEERIASEGLEITILTIGTDRGESSEMFGAWAEAHGATWTHAVDTPEAGVREMYGSTVPRLAVVDGDGTLLLLREGYADADDLLAALNLSVVEVPPMIAPPLKADEDDSWLSFPALWMTLLVIAIAARRTRYE